MTTYMKTVKQRFSKALKRQKKEEAELIQVSLLAATLAKDLSLEGIHKYIIENKRMILNELKHKRKATKYQFYLKAAELAKVLKEAAE